MLVDISLRDYFAAAALQGLCANPGLKLFDETNTAAVAYAHADAMLKAGEEIDDAKLRLQEAGQ